MVLQRVLEKQVQFFQWKMGSMCVYVEDGEQRNINDYARLQVNGC